MRRELKVHAGPGAEPELHSFSSCPDEEGTESPSPGKYYINLSFSFSSCPDEEGTERHFDQRGGGDKDPVSAVVPMRRELKGLPS